MTDQINLSNTQVNNFKSVWLELLKKKISIIYDISKNKNEDFLELLKEFVPEAFNHKSEWEDLYIIKNRKKLSIGKKKKFSKKISITREKKKKKLVLKRKT